MVLKQDGQRFLKKKKKSETIQEDFKNMSILFKNISNVENIITIDFFKKA